MSNNSDRVAPSDFPDCLQPIADAVDRLIGDSSVLVQWRAMVREYYATRRADDPDDGLLRFGKGREYARCEKYTGLAVIHDAVSSHPVKINPWPTSFEKLPKDGGEAAKFARSYADFVNVRVREVKNGHVIKVHEWLNAVTDDLRLMEESSATRPRNPPRFQDCDSNEAALCIGSFHIPPGTLGYCIWRIESALSDMRQYGIDEDRYDRFLRTIRVAQNKWNEVRKRGQRFSWFTHGDSTNFEKRFDEYQIQAVDLATQWQRESKNPKKWWESVASTTRQPSKTTKQKRQSKSKNRKPQSKSTKRTKQPSIASRRRAAAEFVSAMYSEQARVSEDRSKLREAEHDLMREALRMEQRLYEEETVPPHGKPASAPLKSENSRKTPKPVWERIQIREQNEGNDIATLDDKQLRLYGGAATFLQMLIKAKGEMVKGTKLQDACGKRADEIHNELPEPIRNHVERPGKGKRGYRLID